MKELSIEEKAKAYDEAIERAKKWYNAPNIDKMPTYGNRVIEEIFPELKESEDERIRKAIIEFFELQDDNTTYSLIPKKDILAWLEKQNSNVDNANKEYWRGYREGKQEILDKYAELEKQGEQKPAENLIGTWKDMRLEVYQQASGNRHEPNYSDDTTKMFSLNDIDEIIEKMSEQKPTDKVEPKFKVGDWVVYDGWTTRILKVKHDGYVNDKQGFISKERENSMRLWGIADAKDGDVLVTCFEEDNIIIMYHSRCTIDTINVHCCLDNKFVCENLGVFDAEDVKPATREQRDLLFQKMKEDGYEWDAEKKELKEIEDEEYNGEDYGIDSLWHAKNILEETLGKVDGYQTDDGILEHKCAIAAVNKLYKQKPAEWSEEDECYMGECIGAIATKDGWSFEEKRKTKHWLKSIKERYTWKPSDEQILALDSTLQYSQVSHNSYENLNSLYNDLKKLTE